MNRDLLYFHDILERIDRIENYAVDGRAAFFEDTMVQDAILQNLIVIAEASKRISEDARNLAQDIPWQQITGIRNRIVHDYSHIDHTEIWRVVQDDLAPLRNAILQMQAIALQQTPPESDAGSEQQAGGVYK